MLLAKSGGSQEKQYVDSLFQTYLYTGNGSAQTITNGIDLAGEGGLVWLKCRSNTDYHALSDTERGVNKYLISDQTFAQQSETSVTAFNSNGFSLGNWASGNTNARTYASWTFRKAPKFFTHTTKVHTNGTPSTVDLSSLGTVGMVSVKRTDSTSNWFTLHRSLTSGKLVYLNTTAAETTDATISVSGTTLTIASATASGTYVIYAWAHDTATDGMIQCGSFTTDGSGNATVNLGWEPQFLIIKRSSGAENWKMLDSMRGWPADPSNKAYLLPNTSGAEFATTGCFPTATGFNVTGEGTSSTYIYLTIRRPNKPPTSGTEVYNAIARTGTGAAATVTGVGFAPDLVVARRRTSTADAYPWIDRLRGRSVGLYSNLTNSEWTSGATEDLTSFNMDGISVGTDSNTSINTNAQTIINHFFRRAPGFFDVVCYTGTGSNKTESHNLGKAPELWLVKGRSGATQWVWGSSLLANTEKIVMPSPAGKVTDATAWNSTYPTASVISLGTAAAVNTSSATYVCYLWATVAGISKVFSYTGDGGSGKVINCGFSAGARFVMIVRTDTTGSFLIWDSVRGIVAANDPHLALDTTAAEVTTDDSIDPDSTGFAVNQVAATNINVNGATYIGLAIA